MARRKKSKKQSELWQTTLFFVSTIAVIGCLIIYLWVYTEIDESLLAIEIQNSTVIAKKATDQLGMVVAHPETLSIELNAGMLNTL